MTPAPISVAVSVSEGGAVFRLQPRHSRGPHGGDDGAVLNTEGQDRDGVAEDGNVDAVRDAGGGGVLLGLGGPLDTGDIHIAADVAGHGVEEGFPLRPFRDAQMDLRGILDLALPQHFIGILRDFQDHLHIQKTGLDLVFLLQKQNFGIDRT